MNRIALLLAAALIVSVPIVATVATDTLAAAKGKKAAKAVTKDTRAPKGQVSAPKGQPSGGGAAYDFNNDPNTAFIRALSDALGGRGQTSRSGQGIPKAGSAPAARSAAPARGGAAPARS